MSILDAIIQGIVQGLTEFLPVSSSGHLAITQHILGVGTGDSNLFFNVMLHVGTLVAVIAFYHKLVWDLIKEFFLMLKDIIPLFLLFLPIPGTDMKLKDLADRLSASPVLIVTACSLILTSVLLTIGIIRNRKSVAANHKHLATKSNAKATRDNFNVVDAILVGVTQVCAALLPGLSRSGSTLAVGEMRGISKQKALDYTFVLGIPSILAAALLEGVDAIKSPDGLSNVEFLPLIIGMVVSAVVGYLAIIIFKWFLKSDKMEIFVIYTAVVGVAFVVISIIEISTGVNLFTGVPIA